MRAFGLFVVFSTLLGAAAWHFEVGPKDFYARADFSSIHGTVETVQTLTNELGTSVTEWLASLPPTAALPEERSGTQGGTQSGPQDRPAARGQVSARELPSYAPANQVAAIDRAEDEALEVEAREHVARLAVPVAAPIQATRANHFVAPNQLIDLVQHPRTLKRTLAALKAAAGSNSNTRITIVTRTDRIEHMSAEALILEAAGDMNGAVRIVNGDNVRDLTLGAALTEMRELDQRSLRVLRSVSRTEAVTVSELHFRGVTDDTLLEIVDPADAASGQVSLRDLLPPDARLAPDSILYVRTVSPTDDQGLWGVVQLGLMENFARGVAVNRGDRVETYTVDIPLNADEVRPDRHSSFLGRLIHAKSAQSYVYNIRERRMGRNADDIHPGQDIVIIEFSPEELITIYKHFAGQRG